MSAVLQPYGLKPVFSPNEYTTATRYDNGIASGYGTGLLKYQPVALNTSGQIIAAVAGANDFLGSFAGVTWFDSAGVPHSANQWIAGTTVQANQPFWVWVYDDPNQKFSIQADGSLAQSNGGQINFSNIAAGSTTVGLSQATASAASLTTSAQAQLRIVGLDESIGNAWGDAFTQVYVQNARHQYVANKVAV